MSIALRWDDSIEHCQPVLEDAGLLDEGGLESAVMVSIFTDRRVTAEEAAASGGDRRGWWAESDSLREDGDRDKMGSRLWLLEGRPISSATLNRAAEYVEEALAWMVVDGIVSRVDVDTVRLGVWSIGIEVALYRPASDGEDLAYRKLWEWTANAL